MENVKGELLTCCDCGNSFPYPPKQKVDFESRGWCPPKRCPLCRKWKRFIHREEDINEQQ